MTKNAGPRIALIGAGLGGAAAARLLQQAGFEVTIYEQSPSVTRIGAGIHLGPNAVKILQRMGIGEKLVATGSHPDAWVSRMWDTGEVIYSQPLGRDAVERYGAPYLTVHRGDLHLLMLSTVAEGSIRFGKRLQGIDTAGDALRLDFDDGTSAQADFIIGADGLNSRTRELLLGPEAPTYTGVVGHRAIFPAERLKGGLVDDLTKWWAPERHLIAYYVTASREEAYLVTGAPEPEWKSEASWVPSSREEFLGAFEGFHSDAIHLIEHAEEVTKWAFFERSPLPLWSQGRVVLIGDACHPMKPHMGQGAAMAIEDAAVLVRCIEAFGLSDYPATFRSYEALRHERASRVQEVSRSNTWLRDPSDPSWVFGYDAFALPLKVADAA